MAYTEYIYRSHWGIEHVFIFQGKRGGRNEKRAERKKATPEDIRRQNHRNKVNYIRRTIQLNFRQGDLWLTLKYPKGTRKPIGEVKGDFKRFLRRMRDQYKKSGVQLKYIYSIEIGKLGGIHVHLVMNRLNDPRADLMISDAWTRARGMTPMEDMLEDGLCPADGLAHLDHVREVGDGQRLAEYIAKEQPMELDDGTLLSKEELKEILNFGSSRNLERPDPEKKVYAHWTMKAILDLQAEGLNTKPNKYRTEGYTVDKGSWVEGVNEFTGMTYLRYMEYPSAKMNCDFWRSITGG
jgi:hypothetical protein